MFYALANLTVKMGQIFKRNFKNFPRENGDTLSPELKQIFDKMVESNPDLLVKNKDFEQEAIEG